MGGFGKMGPGLQQDARMPGMWGGMGMRGGMRGLDADFERTERTVQTADRTTTVRMEQGVVDSVAADSLSFSLGSGEAAKLRSPLALTIIGGIITSTLGSLLIVELPLVALLLAAGQRDGELRCDLPAELLVEKTGGLLRRESQIEGANLGNQALGPHGADGQKGIPASDQYQMQVGRRMLQQAVQQFDAPPGDALAD